MNIEDYVVRTD